MPAPTLPVSRLIDVSVNLTPAAAAAQSLSQLLILGSSNIINPVEGYRTYSSIGDVAADFGTTAPEYLAAVLWFEQVPSPSSLLIGRWVESDSHGQLLGAPLSQAAQQISNFNGISTGKFVYTLDGAGPLTTGAIDLTSAQNLPAVAAAISGQTTGLTFAWDAFNQRFTATSASTGTGSTVSFLSTPGSGVDISGLLGMQQTEEGSYVSPGQASVTAVASVAYFDLNYGQKFYGVTVLAATDNDALDIAAYVEAAGNKHIYFCTTQEAGTLVASDTANLAYKLMQFAYKRTWVQFSSTNQYAAISAAARILTVDYTGNATVITLMYKQEPGIVPENINPNQAAAIDGFHANCFAEYNNNTAIIQNSQTSSGLFLDIITTTDWLSLTVQAALYNLLYATPTKIPQTDAGSQQMVAAIAAVCAQGVENGMIAPGVWLVGGFGLLKQGDFLDQGFYIYAPPVALQSAQDRDARVAVPIQVAVKLAGAVQTIAMTINVNQ